jgi:hypothetical protein
MGLGHIIIYIVNEMLMERIIPEDYFLLECDTVQSTRMFWRNLRMRRWRPQVPPEHW